MSDTAIIEAIDTLVLRECCGRFATGVTVITTRTPEGDHGMTVSAFMSVSLDPPLICISVDNRARMLPMIEAVGRYAVNVLPEHMSGHALHFAGRSQDGLTDPFEDRHGLHDNLRVLADCFQHKFQRIAAGDHVLLIGLVRHLSHDPGARPLLWHGGQFGGLAA